MPILAVFHVARHVLRVGFRNIVTQSKACLGMQTDPEFINSDIVAHVGLL